MLIEIPGAITPDQVHLIRAAVENPGAPWVDGRVTAGYQGAPVKRNQQIDEMSPMARELGDLIVGRLECNPRFISACLPLGVYPPMFNRYEAGMTFGSHVDGAMRIVPGNGRRLRTDISATLFLSEPDEYEGGELQIDDAYGMHSVKLRAGDMIVYPASSVHRVTPVTRGIRLACFFWVQSMVRDDARRTLLFDMDNAIQTLNRTGAEETARTALVGNYHNLIRMWSEV
jgi:PKHD-type hydroxylase